MNELTKKQQDYIKERLHVLLQTNFNKEEIEKFYKMLFYIPVYYFNKDDQDRLKKDLRELL